MTTIYDIAKETGYSPATVSKVLNNYKGTSKRANKIINEAVEKMNYIPNGSARGLIIKKTYLVGVILNEDSDEGLVHFHFSEIMNSFKTYMEEEGFDILFVNNKIGSKQVTFYEHCKYRSLDGVLIASGVTGKVQQEQIESIVYSDIPCVSVENSYENTITIVCDNEDGTRKALDYFAFLGHSKIGMVNINECSEPCKERFLTYEKFMSEKEFEIKDGFVVNVNRFTYGAGVEAAEQYIRQGIDKLPTAIFCICDEVAFGLIDTLKKASINVPEDVSVIGFDDIRTAKYNNLTTIRQNRKNIGEIAGEKLINCIENANVNKEYIKTETELIVRGTCKNIK